MEDLAALDNDYSLVGLYEYSGIPEKIFERDSSHLYEPHIDEAKVRRDADAFDDELSRYGLVYVVKKDRQKRNSKSTSPLKDRLKRRYKRDVTKEKRVSKGSNKTVAEIISNHTDYSVTLSIPYSSQEEKERYLKEIQQIFVNPPETKINADGWPDKSVYDPAKDVMFWWRNDPVANQHHEHWHIVMPSSDFHGIRKDREGENFIYMHRHMLSRYDADRLGCGLEIVKPLPDYTTPIPEAFYPDPYLSQDNDSNPSTPRVWFPARPVNEKIKDVVQDSGDSFTILSVNFLNHTYTELVKWIDHNYTKDHHVQLKWDDSGALTLGSRMEVVLHNLGHEMLGYIMHPYSIGYPPSVLVGARGGLRDPLFWMWHRHLDNLFLRFQNHLGPNDFKQDSPNVTIRPIDVYLAFTDILLDVDPSGKKDDWQAFGDKTFGGANFDLDCKNETVVTTELQTKMKNRILVWREDNYDEENITYVYPRDWYYFIRVRNDVDITLILTFRIFIVPSALADSPPQWIELDKFKRALKPFEKAVITRACDKAIVIRKPAQKTEEQMDATQLNLTYQRYLGRFNEKEVTEILSCDCGWPYHMILPRGTREGMPFKMIIYISDGLNDLLPTYDQCGSTLLCGGQKWEDKVEAKPFGYPFNRPFKNGSHKETFEGLNNVVIHDFTIKLVDNFTEV